ncbi:MAG TPA: APC family permease [Streptosporangiaceae bacterium]|nr:APC family permease [Streptosporangiaceae bacterium]
MATESVAAPTVADRGLKRHVGPIGLAWASEGSIIGSGWLFGAFLAAQSAGTAALLAWIGTALVFMVLALIHSELGAMYPVSGGTARFPHYAFGSLAGASFGWFSWLQAVTVAPIEVLATISYGSVHLTWLTHTVGTGANASQQLTAAGYGVAVALMAIFTIINFLGIRWLAHTNSTFTWWKIFVPVLLIIVFASTHFHGSNFGSHGGFAPYGAKGVFAAVSTAGVAFALLGFEQADQLAGESRNPQRDIPRAIIGAMILGALIYVLLQVVFIGALPASALTHGWAALAFKGDAGPFAGLSTLIGLGWLATVLYIDAIVSPGGTGLIYVTSTSRISYGLSRNGYVPEIFESTDRRGVPWFGLLFTFIMSLILFLPFPSWHQLVSFITSATVLMYAGAPLALGALRKQVPDARRPFRLSAAGFWSPLAFILAGLIIYWSGWPTIWRLGVALLIGYVLIGINAAFKLNKRMPRFDRAQWKAASWLPVYLVGLGVASWQGTFGSYSAGHLHLWWDILAIAVFSLVIYYWAQAVRLPDAEARELIRMQAAPVESEG